MKIAVDAALAQSDQKMEFICVSPQERLCRKLGDTVPTGLLVQHGNYLTTTKTVRWAIKG